MLSMDESRRRIVKDRVFNYSTGFSECDKYLQFRSNKNSLETNLIFSALLSSQRPSSINRWSDRKRESVGATPGSISFNWHANSVKL